jgi:hypothetical protein
MPDVQAQAIVQRLAYNLFKDIDRFIAILATTKGSINKCGYRIERVIQRV